MYSLSCGGHKSEIPIMRLKSSVSGARRPPRALGRIPPVLFQLWWLPALLGHIAPIGLCAHAVSFSPLRQRPSPLSHKDTCRSCVSGTPQCCH